MKAASRNFIVDIVLFLQAIGVVVTGIVLKYVIPHGPGLGRGHGFGRGGFRHGWGGAWEPQTLLGLSRHEWGDIHFWIAMGLVALVLLHIVLHWSWVACRFKNLLGSHPSETKGCLEGEEVPERSSFADARSIAGFRRYSD